MEIDIVEALALLARSLTAHDSTLVADVVKPPVGAPRRVNNFISTPPGPLSTTAVKRPLQDAVPARTLDPTTLSGIGLII